jgi:hypothetical protein
VRSPRGQSRDDLSTNLVHPGWVVGELAEQLKNEDAAAIAPLLDADALIRAWLGGDLQLHLKLRFRPELPSADKCQLCAGLEVFGSPPKSDGPQHAVPRVRDFYVDSGGERPEWLDRPVLVGVVDARQKRKRVPCSGASAVVVGLTPTHLRPICSPNSGQLAWQSPVEFGSLLVDREGHGVFLLPRELASSRGRPPAANKCPGEMLDRRAVVAGDVAQQQAPAQRHRRNVVDDYGEAVTFRVVLRMKGAYWISVSVAAPGVDVSLERLGVDYRAKPLEPRAVKERMVGQSLSLEAGAKEPERHVGDANRLGGDGQGARLAEGARPLGEDRQVGVEPDSFNASDAQGE